MVLQEASFPSRPQKKVNDWSPIDRMLANKRSGSGRPQKSGGADLPPLQRMGPAAAPTPQASAGAQANAGTQTASWAALVSEAAAPERARANALEKELKSQRALLKTLEEGGRAADAKEAEEQRRALEIQEQLQDSERQRLALEAELGALRRAAAEAAAGREEERRLWDRDRREWQEERAALKEEASRAFDLRKELGKRNGDIGDLRTAYNTLDQEKKALQEEYNKLLERLEVEQAAMIARVEKLEQRAR